MRQLLCVAVAAIWSVAASAQPAGWTIKAQPNADAPAAFKVSATRTVGEAKLQYERSMLNGISYKIEHQGCTSSSGGAGSEAAGPERIAAIRTAMTELVKDKDNFCKLPAAARTGLTTGIDGAIAAADGAYERGRPTITVAPRTATRDGWALQDRPGDSYDGLVGNHILTMRRATGPILLTYTIDLPLYSDKVSAGNRSIEGKVRDCDYSDSDTTEFVSPAARAKAFREQVSTNLAATGCDATPAQIAAAITGFDQAYAALDLWASERLDERKMLLQAAGGDVTAEVMSASGSAMDAAEEAAKAAACAQADAHGGTPPGC